MKKAKKILMIVTLILSIIILGYYNWLNYKTTAHANKASLSVGFSTEKVNTHNLLNGKTKYDMKFADELAHLSSEVYKKEKYPNSFKDWVKIKMPIISSKKGKNYLEGLYYEVWTNKMLNDSTIIAIVFKGTENLNDWKTNSRWFKKVVKIKTNDYYDQLNETSDNLIEKIKSIVQEDSIKIITTGHSLGGGLAQFMAYRINEIKDVYAFNPSPVTGYYDVPRSERKENKQGCKIYRIYESGEALSTLRKLMTILYPAPLIKTKNPELIRIRTSFTSDTSTITQHSMKLLAENLKQIKLDSNYIPVLKPSR